MFESKAAQGDGFVVGWEEEMIAAVVVGKFYRRGSQEKTSRRRLEFLLFPAPHD
jgi:hypothetical protein